MGCRRRPNVQPRGLGYQLRGGDNKNEGSCDSHEDNSNEDSQDKLTSNEGDTSSNRTTESEDTDYSSDRDHDKLYATDGDNGETLDGEFGFTSL